MKDEEGERSPEQGIQDDTAIWGDMSMADMYLDLTEKKNRRRILARISESIRVSYEDQK